MAHVYTPYENDEVMIMKLLLVFNEHVNVVKMYVLTLLMVLDFAD